MNDAHGVCVCVCVCVHVCLGKWVYECVCTCEPGSVNVHFMSLVIAQPWFLSLHGDLFFFSQKYKERIWYFELFKGGLYKKGKPILENNNLRGPIISDETSKVHFSPKKYNSL